MTESLYPWHPYDQVLDKSPIGRRWRATTERRLPVGHHGPGRR